jgi:hypothetical protein
LCWPISICPTFRTHACGLTNDAFALLDSAVAEFLTTTAEGLIELTAILQYHVFFGILTSTIFGRPFRLWREALSK